VGVVGTFNVRFVSSLGILFLLEYFLFCILCFAVVFGIHQQVVRRQTKSFLRV